MKSKYALAIIITISVCFIPTVSAYAWGTLAHRVIAQIALRYTSPQSHRQLALLLDMRSIVDVATDADEWRASRPETSPWHFVNIPFTASTYDADRDCPNGDCVIAAINKYQEILSTPNNSRAARQEALIFLVHLVADIHQPLHCINDSDRGGNDVTVSFFGGPTNLHAVWDKELLRRTRLRERAYVHRLMTWLSTQDIKEFHRGSVIDWVLEAHRLARTHAYRLPPDHNLRSGYYNANLPILEAQLAKAAVRLAYVLDTVFQHHSDQ